MARKLRKNRDAVEKAGDFEVRPDAQGYQVLDVVAGPVASFPASLQHDGSRHGAAHHACNFAIARHHDALYLGRHR